MFFSQIFIENSKLKPISHSFSSSSSFLPPLVKTFLKIGQNVLSTDFYEKLHDLILIWRIQKSNSFSHIFSSSYSFLLLLVKNVLKNESIFLPQIFMKIAIRPNFDMENSKIKLIFQNLFIYIFIFASFSQRMAYKMSQKIFMKSQISRGAFNQVGHLFINLKYC